MRLAGADCLVGLDGTTMFVAVLFANCDPGRCRLVSHHLATAAIVLRHVHGTQVRAHFLARITRTFPSPGDRLVSQKRRVSFLERVLSAAISNLSNNVEVVERAEIAQVCHLVFESTLHILGALCVVVVARRLINWADLLLSD